MEIMHLVKMGPFYLLKSNKIYWIILQLNTSLFLVPSTKSTILVFSQFHLLHFFSGKKSKKIIIPSICPFKEELLKEAEAYKEHKKQEQIRKREQIIAERSAKKEEEKETLEQVLKLAEMKQKMHKDKPELEDSEDVKKFKNMKTQSLYKEFKKVRAWTWCMCYKCWKLAPLTQWWTKMKKKKPQTWKYSSVESLSFWISSAILSFVINQLVLILH